MSFERTKNSIENLSCKDVITLDLLFDMMVCVASDVKDYNNVNLTDTAVGDVEAMYKKIYNVLNQACAVYDKNKHGLAEYSDSFKKRFADLEGKLKDVLPEIEVANQRIEDAESKKAELADKQKELEVKNAQLLVLVAECESLQRQIELVSDANLEDSEKEKEALTADLAERNARADKLNQEKNVLSEQNEAAEARIKGIDSEIQALDTEKKELDSEEAALLAEKRNKELEIEELKNRLEAYKAWLESYPELKSKLESDHDEYKIKITTIINAVNSALSDTYLKENLFKTNGALDAFAVESCPDYALARADIASVEELDRWFEDTNRRINGLISVCEKRLKVLAEQAAKLVKEDNQ